MRRVNDLTFEEWFEKVNACVMKRIGVGVLDLADFPSYDSWLSGAEPEEGALEAILNDDIYSDYATQEE